MTSTSNCRCRFSKPRWTITRKKLTDTNWNVEIGCPRCGADLPKSEILRALKNNDWTALFFEGFDDPGYLTSEMVYVAARVVATIGTSEAQRLAADAMLERTGSYEDALELFTKLEQSRATDASSGVIRCLWKLGRREEAIRKLAAVRASGRSLSNSESAQTDFRAMDNYASGANPTNINMAARGLALSTAPNMRHGQAWLATLCEQYVPGYEQARALDVLTRVIQKHVSPVEQLLWCGVAKTSIEGGSRKMVWFLLSNRFLYATHGKTIPATRISIDQLILNGGYPLEQDWGFIGSQQQPRMFDLGRNILMEEGEPLNGLPARSTSDPRGAVRLLPLAAAVRLAHDLNANSN